MKQNPYDAGNLWGADDLEEIVNRNAAWAQAFIDAGVKALMKDGRPLYTDKIPDSERLANLLNAPPQFWDALQASDPETAAALVASVIRARQKGKIAKEGPRAGEVVPEDGPAPEDLGLPQELPAKGPPAAFGTATSPSGSSGPGAVGYTG